MTLATNPHQQAERLRHGAILDQVMRKLGGAHQVLDVGDAGCGAGGQCRLWAGHGHRVFGADPNPALVALARRAGGEGHEILYDLARPTALPWPDRSMDVALAPALLEDVADWRACLAELVRVLRPGGVLHLGAGASGAAARAGWSGLGARLACHGLASLDHVELAGLDAHGRARRAAFALLRAVPPLRCRAQLASAGVLAFKAG